MKKLIAFVLCMALLAGCMFACAPATPAAEATEAPAAATEAPAAATEAPADSGLPYAGKTIAFCPKTLSNAYFVGMQEALLAEAASFGFKVEVAAPPRESDVDQQIAIVENYIQMGVDAIIIVPGDSSQVVDVINEAAKAGIPVLVCDTPAAESNYISFIGTNNYEGGRLAARWFGENVKGEVVILDAQSGNQATTDRHNGFLDQIADYPDIQVVGEAYANADRSEAMTQMENFLTAHPNVAGVFACADMMAQGAAEAVIAAGKKDQVTICGFDGQPDACQDVLDNFIQATVAQRPATMGRLAIQKLVEYLEGKEIEPKIDTGCTFVTSENAADFLNWT